MQSETLAQEFARLVKEYHEGDEHTKPEAWNLLADYAVDNADAISAALSDKQAGEVKIKPLEWSEVRKDDGSRWRWVAGDYGVTQMDWNGFSSFDISRGHWLAGGPFSDLEAAKAAAQADYEQRIRSALVDVPAEPVAWLPADDAPRGVYALIKHRSGQLDLCYKTDNGEPFLETWRYAGTAKRAEQAPWPESYIPVSDLRTSPPLSREGEDSAEVERLRGLLSRAEEYVIDGVTNAKAEAEMNAPYPARAHRYDAALAEVRQLYADIQAALAATRSGSAIGAKGSESSNHADTERYDGID